MTWAVGHLGRLLAGPVRAVKRAVAEARYRRRVARGEAAGTLSYRFMPYRRPPRSPFVEVRLPATGDGEVSAAEAEAWRQRQTLHELTVAGYDQAGQPRWRVGATGPLEPAGGGWFAAPGCLPDLEPAALEAALLVAAAEDVDAVVLRERVEPPLRGSVSAGEAHRDPQLRRFALFAARSYTYESADDTVHLRQPRALVKLVDTGGVGSAQEEPACADPRRRGPYLSTKPLGSNLEVAVRDAAALERHAPASDRPGVLVLAPFIAKGGAEHTLLETMRVLRSRFDFSVATLAPHRPQLGDRRSDLTAITERVYCLGDLLHPAAMYGALLALVDGVAPSVVYNANGSTLFYEFAPRLRTDRPSLRIIDHLYDHRVGYIEQYGPHLLPVVDAVVAENRRIAETLAGRYGWPSDRAPVIWPCGRPDEAFPTAAERPGVRAEVRRELGFRDDDLIILTAARMHPQKRPLDLVALAERVQALPQVVFLVVGGGVIEAEMDAAIAARSGGRIRRLPFTDDVPRLITAVDAGCLVSEYEGLPVFMLECLQAGRPFIGTRVGDIGEVLDDTGAGIVVDDPGDLDALVGAVRRLADPAERAQLGVRAAAAGSRFGVADCAARYAAVLDGGRHHA